MMLGWAGALEQHMVMSAAAPYQPLCHISFGPAEMRARLWIFPQGQLLLYFGCPWLQVAPVICQSLPRPSRYAGWELLQAQHQNMLAHLVSSGI